MNRLFRFVVLIFLFLFLLRLDGLAQEHQSNPTNQAFSIRRNGEEAWLVRPNGKQFFSFGVCCVNQGVSGQEFDRSNPAYVSGRHYADSNQWATATLRLLKQGGFTTVGGWSD